ncbi:MAG TPA: DUF2948 family protein [Rhizomicrobium sp.]|nr:DUF2948 family protein [Rhizomicrobium sp.]
MTREVLAAADAEDLDVISAKLQDAVARVGDLVWLPRQRRFAALFNRFKWENPGKQGDLRVRAGLHFDGVLAVQSHNILHGDPDAILSLLALRFSPNGGEDPGGVVHLEFAGGGSIRLVVECIDAELSDVSGAWAARGRPEHETGS